MRTAAKRYGISPTTVQKWRGRETSVDTRMGPKEARSTVLSPEEEAIVVAFRRYPVLIGSRGRRPDAARGARGQRAMRRARQLFRPPKASRVSRS
ncbi:hypothetical protein MPAR162_02700 [Methylorubrum populi]|uniref:Transposase n=1 Tax=Methylobacterium radiotolerans TaxID=31998 RepID=A0ABU7TB77_9HYPH